MKAKIIDCKEKKFPQVADCMQSPNAWHSMAWIKAIIIGVFSASFNDLTTGQITQYKIAKTVRPLPI